MNTATKHTNAGNLLTAKSESCRDITNLLLFSDSKTLKLNTSVLNRYYISWYGPVFATRKEKKHCFFFYLGYVKPTCGSVLWGKFRTRHTMLRIFIMLHYVLLSCFITSWTVQAQQGQLNQISDATRGTWSLWLLYKFLMSLYEFFWVGR